jgi:hypothetical protein
VLRQLAMLAPHARVRHLFGRSCGFRLRRLSGCDARLPIDAPLRVPLAPRVEFVLASFRSSGSIFSGEATSSSAEFTCHASSDATQPPNQTMQLTATRLAIYLHRGYNIFTPVYARSR